MEMRVLKNVYFNISSLKLTYFALTLHTVCIQLRIANMCIADVICDYHRLNCDLMSRKTELSLKNIQILPKV